MSPLTKISSRPVWEPSDFVPMFGKNVKGPLFIYHKPFGVTCSDQEAESNLNSNITCSPDVSKDDDAVSCDQDDLGYSLTLPIGEPKKFQSSFDSCDLTVRFEKLCSPPRGGSSPLPQYQRRILFEDDQNNIKSHKKEGQNCTTADSMTNSQEDKNFDHFFEVQKISIDGEECETTVFLVQKSTFSRIGNNSKFQELSANFEIHFNSQHFLIPNVHQEIWKVYRSIEQHYYYPKSSSSVNRLEQNDRYSLISWMFEVF
jgi:hypothetical protein